MRRLMTILLHLLLLQRVFKCVWFYRNNKANNYKAIEISTFSLLAAYNMFNTVKDVTITLEALHTTSIIINNVSVCIGFAEDNCKFSCFIATLTVFRFVYTFFNRIHGLLVAFLGSWILVSKMNQLQRLKINLL